MIQHTRKTVQNSIRRIIHWLAKRLVELFIGTIILFFFSYIFGYFEEESFLQKIELAALLTLFFMMLSYYLICSVLVEFYPRARNDLIPSVLMGILFSTNYYYLHIQYGVEVFDRAGPTLLIVGALSAACIEYFYEKIRLSD